MLTPHEQISLRHDRRLSAFKTSPPLLIFIKKFADQRFCSSEIGVREFIQNHAHIDKAFFSGQPQHPKRPGIWQVQAFCVFPPLRVVYE